MKTYLLLLTILMTTVSFAQLDRHHGKLDLFSHQINNLSTKGTLSKTKSVAGVPGEKTLSSLPTFLDYSFGTNGTVRNAISGGNGTTDKANSVAIQSDGKIVAAGNSYDASGLDAFAIARYNSNGTLDSTFGTNGSVRNFISGGGGFWDEANSVAIQSDGKIVAAGYSRVTSGYYAFAVARYNTNGTLDNTFGTNGSVRTAISGGNGQYDLAYSVAIQSDGKIVAAGVSMDASGNSCFAIARYNIDGTLDSTFGTNGSVRYIIIGGARKSDGAQSVAIQSDGKIVAAGYSYDAPMGVINSPAFAIARFNTNGTPDTTFGSYGSVRNVISGGTDSKAYSVTIQSDGKIVAAGYSIDASAHYAFAIARYNTDGTLDNTFGTNGSLRTTISGGFSDQANSVAIQPDGKIVAAGSSRNSSGYIAFAIARYNTDGTLDNTFGTNGSVRNAISGGGNVDDEANSVAIQSDGKIVAAGFSYDISGNYIAFAIARYLGANPAYATAAAAANISDTSATLNGSVYPWNVSTTVIFLFGTTSGVYTDSVSASPTTVDGDTVTSISAALSGLTGGTTYYYRVSGSSLTPLNYFVSDEKSFETISTPPLPVELTSFKAESVMQNVELSWTTATEVNNYGFDIERSQKTEVSSQNLRWEKIGFVKGSGNSNSPKSYSFTDATPTNGKVQYRLKQIDNDGTYKYSQVVDASFMKPTKFELSQNYPNPFNPSTTIKFGLPSDSKVILEVFNTIGQKVATLVNEQMTAGYHQVEFSASNLASGIYFYRIQTNGFVSVKKLLLLK